MKPTNSWPVVSAILQKKDKSGIKIFIQTRWKPLVDSPYSGMLEIPAGGIGAYEDVYSALKREVREECGLKVVKILQNFKSSIEKPTSKDKSYVFKPFLCQQVLSTRNGLPWIGFVFLCEVSGKVKMQKSEAKDPQWLSTKELEKVIKKNPKKIFPLQLPVLKFYLNYIKRNRY